MELTKLIHTLTIGGVEYVIDEPVGFDGLKAKISRGDYHGMSAEVSASKLEFYNNANRNAATLIRTAYNTDIDTEIVYTVKDTTGELLYSGVLDLSTYSESIANATKIAVTVGEVGVKTTFNNRTETEVDLNKTTTMDGSPIAHNPQWKNLLIPAKTIHYKNKMTQPETVLHDKDVAEKTLQLPDDKQWMYISLRLDKINLAEFGTFEPQLSAAGLDDLILDGYCEPLFDKGSDFGEKYGAGSAYDIDIDITIKMKFNDNIFVNTTKQPYMQFNFGLHRPKIVDGEIMVGTKRYISNDGGDYDYGSGSYNQRKTENCHDELTYTLHGYIRDCTEERLYLGFYVYNFNQSTNGKHAYNNEAPFTIEIQQGSYVRMTLKSEQKSDVKADMLMIHEAFNKVVEIISDNKLTVKSDWYSRFDSVVNNKSPLIAPQNREAFLNCVGGGALKAITNGYKIRGLYSNADKERNMPMSFKNLVEAMDALDCIGWGLVEENGELFVRVERWNWFYKNDIILTISDPNEKTRAFDNSSVITELKIGYKKYTTTEDYNSNDNFHSERTFTTTTSAVAKQLSKLCAFIADNYAIEETRRAKDTIDESEEFKYDENIFVFALKGERAVYSSVMDYTIPADIETEVSILNKADEVYNALLSPTRNAMRWIERLFNINGIKPFDLTSGTVNYMAAFIAKHTHNITYMYHFFLDDSMAGIPEKGYQTEDDSWLEVQVKEDMPLCERYYALNREGEDIPQATDKVFARLLRAETLKIKYPLTLNQYKAIKANPYGIIVVDGESCYLKEMTYEFKTGLAEMTLIPKYE